MKEKMKNMVTVLGIALMLAISFYGWIAYETRFKITYIGTEESSDGGAKVIFQMLGEPGRDRVDDSGKIYGVTNGRAIVKQGDTEIKTVGFSVQNGGAPLSEENWEVAFDSECAEIVLTGSGSGEGERIVVYYDGTVEEDGDRDSDGE